MKKITLFVAIIFTATTLFSQVASYKWYGAQTDQVWDYSTANWLDPAFPIPLPKTFSEGATAIFDDSSIEGSDTLKIAGNIIVNDININAAKTYVLRRTVTTDSLKGAGTLIKDGVGIFVMDLLNTLEGGTLIKNGRLVQEKPATPNIFGKKIVFHGGTVNVGTTGSTSSAYSTISVPVEIPEGKTGKMELARYSYFLSPVTGSGTLELYCAGERTHIGHITLPAGATQLMPVMSGFNGSIAIKKLVTSVTPGFWGAVMSTNKSYKDSLEFGFNVDSTFYNKKVTIGSGATIAAHSGTRAFAIGELNAEDNTSNLVGYRSASNSPKIYYYVGGLNTDVVFPGRVCQAPGISTRYNHVAFIKVGTGTYTLTHPHNDMIGGLLVKQGTVLVSDAVLRGPNYFGGVGNFAIAYAKGIIGGTGRIQGNIDVYGGLKPGNNGVGKLLITDTLSLNPLSKYDIPVSYSFKYKNNTGAETTYTYRNGGNRAFNLNLHEGSVSEFEIQSATAYDKVIASGKLKFVAVATGLGKPKIRIIAKEGAQINDGDKFEIITASTVDAASDGFDIEYPRIEGITWSVEAKYDSILVDQEEFTHTAKVVTQTNADSTAVTVFKTEGKIKNYKVIVTAQGGTGVKNLTENTLKVYPNPVIDIMELKTTDHAISSVQIVNLQGQLIISKEINAFSYTMNLSDLPAGIYFAKVKCCNELLTRKIVRK